jgi:phage baseplate assembly protein W
MAVVSRAERYTPLQKEKVIYKDIFSNNLFNVDTKDIDTVSNEDAVKQSILNILLTSTGERFFNYNFGSDINRVLFENMTPQTTNLLKSIIQRAVENYEPRAKIRDLIVSPSYDDNAYNISIVFNIINKTTPINLDFLLNRVR